MSASPIARQLNGISGIPTRKVVINHENEMPTDYGTTPGGTLFGTTPGGTRIVYERAFLMQLRQSPLARTPPVNLPVIPGVTAPKESATPNHNNNKHRSQNSNNKSQSDSPTPSGNEQSRGHDSIKEEEEAQFDMDI